MNLAEEKKKIEESLKEQIAKAFGEKTNVAVKYEFETNTVNAVLITSLNKENTKVEVYKISYEINKGRISLSAEQRNFLKDEVSIVAVIRVPLFVEDNFMMQITGLLNQITKEYKAEEKEDSKPVEKEES